MESAKRMQELRKKMLKKRERRTKFTESVTSLAFNLIDIELFYKTIDFNIEEGIAEDFENLEMVDRIIRNLETINTSANYIKHKLDFSKMEILKNQFLNQKKKLLRKELEEFN